MSNLGTHNLSTNTYLRILNFISEEIVKKFVKFCLAVEAYAFNPWTLESDTGRSEASLSTEQVSRPPELNNKPILKRPKINK